MMRYRVPIFKPRTLVLPLEWDWRCVEGCNWISQIQNQGNADTCVAFAVTAAVESHLMIRRRCNRSRLNLSEAVLFFTANRQCFDNDQMRGWYIPEALDFLTREGICYERCFPYRPENQRAILVRGSDRTYKITGWKVTDDPVQMKRWLVEEGPLIGSFALYNDFRVFWNRGAEGVYKRSFGRHIGSHAVLVVGYSDKERCWICKNSQPVRQGYGGFFKIAYGTAGIDFRMYLIEDVYAADARSEISYDPLELHIKCIGSKGWLLSDGKRLFKLFDNKADSVDALRVARRHTVYGMIGKNIQRDDHHKYRLEYWRGISGLPFELLSKPDFIHYNPLDVIALDVDEKGWELKYGERFKRLAHDLDDALSALHVFQGHSRKGFIGRGNKRPNWRDYMMTYWEWWV